MNILAETKAGATTTMIISLICNIVLVLFNIYLLYCIVQTKKNTDEILRRMGNGIPFRHREDRPKPTSTPVVRTPITSSAKMTVENQAEPKIAMPTGVVIVQLTEAEKEYLSMNVIKPYGNSVQGITKRLDYNGSKYYLELRLQENGKLRFLNLNPMADSELFRGLKTGEYKTMAEFGYVEIGEK